MEDNNEGNTAMGATDTTSGHLSYEATCMKLRRSVIMIIACNRMKKLAKKQTSTALEEEEINKCVTIVTAHKSAQPLNAEIAEALFTELASASFGPNAGSNGPIPRLQNQ